MVSPRLVVPLSLLALVACGSDSDSPPGDEGPGSSSTGAGAAGASGSGASGSGASGSGASGGGGSTSSGGAGVGGSGGGPDGPNVDVSDPQLHDFDLDPHELDPSTVDSLSTQYAVLDTRTTPIGKLVVFLPGANNVPGDWHQHGIELAKFGYHVLVPHYNNRWSSDGTCDGQGNSCGVDTRWEALVGEDASDAIEISRADSAEGRVVTMLQYLTTEHPGGDWGWFLDGDDLRYPYMVIAGISHGAASTGLYAVRRPFSRAVLHSSGPAGDTGEAKQTPLAVWYALAHTEDPSYDPIVDSWDNWGIEGAPTSIDGQSPPYGGSHRLITSAATSYPHCSVVVHDSTPLDGNEYVFEPAWRYMYGVAP